MRRDDGIRSSTALFVELARGLAATNIEWEVTDRASGAGCLIHYFQEGYEYLYDADRLRALRIENGHLVAVVHGFQLLNRDENGNPLVRDGAAWCKEGGGKLHCKAYDPRYHGHIGAFAIGPDGALHRQSAGEAPPRRDR